MILSLGGWGNPQLGIGHTLLRGGLGACPPENFRKIGALRLIPRHSGHTYV